MYVCMYLIVAHRTFVSPKSRHAGESVRVRADGEDDHVHGRSCVIRRLIGHIRIPGIGLELACK